MEPEEHWLGDGKQDIFLAPCKILQSTEEN